MNRFDPAQVGLTWRVSFWAYYSGVEGWPSRVTSGNTWGW